MSFVLSVLSAAETSSVDDAGGVETLSFFAFISADDSIGNIAVSNNNPSANNNIFFT